MRRRRRRYPCPRIAPVLDEIAARG